MNPEPYGYRKQVINIATRIMQLTASGKPEDHLFFLRSHVEYLPKASVDMTVVYDKSGGDVKQLKVIADWIYYHTGNYLNTGNNVSLYSIYLFLTDFITLTEKVFNVQPK